MLACFNVCEKLPMSSRSLYHTLVQEKRLTKPEDLFDLSDWQGQIRAFTEKILLYQQCFEANAVAERSA